MQITLKKKGRNYEILDENGNWQSADVTITTDRKLKREKLLNENEGHKIKLPKYSLANELWNSISHGLGSIFGFFVLIFLIFTLAKNELIIPQSEFPYYLASVIIYGIGLVFCFTTSCLYHALAPNRGKRVFRVLDHDMIFLLLAGTYTPICLTAMREMPLFGVIPYSGWIMFGIIWACAIVGIVFNSINLEESKVLSMLIYLGAGWLIVIASYDLIVNTSIGIAFYYILAGGITYTIGSILFGIGKKFSFMHSVFHFFILAAAILQFIGIYLGIFLF